MVPGQFHSSAVERDGEIQAPVRMLWCSVFKVHKDKSYAVVI